MPENRAPLPKSSFMPFNLLGAEETGGLWVHNFWLENLFSMSTFGQLELEDFATVPGLHIGGAIFLFFGALQALHSRELLRRAVFHFYLRKTESHETMLEF